MYVLEVARTRPYTPRPEMAERAAQPADHGRMWSGTGSTPSPTRPLPGHADRGVGPTVVTAAGAITWFDPRNWVAIISGVVGFGPRVRRRPWRSMPLARDPLGQSDLRLDQVEGRRVQQPVGLGLDRLDDLRDAILDGERIPPGIEITVLCVGDAAPRRPRWRWAPGSTGSSVRRHLRYAPTHEACSLSLVARSVERPGRNIPGEEGQVSGDRSYRRVRNTAERGRPTSPRW